MALLFSDIEGSTRLLLQLGHRYEDALEAHRAIIRKAIANHDGDEQAIEGDGFFVTFPTAAQAIVAAVEAQIGLTARAWPDGATLRVRMGVHVGEVRPTAEDLVGIAIHEAARMKDAAHGGQIVASALARDLCDLAPASRVTFRSLGRHQLKDVAHPIDIVQVCHPDLAVAFPPLHSVPRRAGGLPVARTLFIGRDRELNDLAGLLRDHRLVTLTGIGGCGKTRLAVEVASLLSDGFADGAHFVDLHRVADDASVADAVADAFGLAGSHQDATGSIIGLGGRSDESVVAYLVAKDCLIVLDNCEHLLDAAADLVERLQAACPRVTILATSREALGVDGERTFRVRSLQLPDGPTVACDSVSMFVSRAQDARAGFELTDANAPMVAEICRRLDGIPLAIEFAAARIGHLTPEQIASKLDDRFGLLTGGRRRVQRHRTLQATLDWSYDLLSESERVLLTRLSVFPAEFRLVEAEAICAGGPLAGPAIVDHLGSLVAKSLVQTEDASDELVYRLLETVRAYGADRLVLRSEAEGMRDRHRDWLLERVEALSWPEILGSGEAAQWLTQEWPNLRAAMAWSEAQGRLDLLARLFVRGGVLWSAGNHVEDRLRWHHIVATVGTDLGPNERAVALLIGVSQARFLQRLGDSIRLAESAVEVAREAEPAILMTALTTRSFITAIAAAFTGDRVRAQEARNDIEEAEVLSRDLPSSMQAAVLMVSGLNEISIGSLPTAAAAFEAAAKLLAAEPGDFRGNQALLDLAVVVHALGDHGRAAVLLDEHLAKMPPEFGAAYHAGVIAAVLAGRSVEAGARYVLQTHTEVIASVMPGAVGEWITGAAAVLVNASEDELAARLLSWVRTVTLDQSRPTRTPLSYVIYRHYVGRVRDALGQETSHRSRAAGSKLTEEEAVLLAVEGMRALLSGRS